MPAGDELFWDCPRCQRSVPARFTRCPCGFSRVGFTGIQVKPRRQSRLLLWCSIGVVAVLVAGIAFVQFGRGTDEAPLPATPPSTEGEPVSSAEEGAISPLGSDDQSQSELTAEDVFTAAAPSVVIVETNDAQGSGVVLSRSIVVTNRHVVDSSSVVGVRQGDREWSASIVTLDEEHDLATLSVPGLDLPAATVEPSEIRIGQRVFAVGAPQGFELTLSDGVVSGLRSFEGGTVIQVSAPISPGSSGGGLFDSRGRLIGITTFGWRGGSDLNFALPIEWAQSIHGRVLPLRMAAPTTPRRLALGYGGWQVDEARNPTTNEPSFRAILRGEGPAGPAAPTLLLICSSEYRPIVGVVFGQQQIKHDGFYEDIHFQIDGRPTERSSWIASGPNELVAEGHTMVVPFLQKLAGARTVTFEARSFDGSARARFDLGPEGGELVQRFRSVVAEGCGHLAPKRH